MYVRLSATLRGMLEPLRDRELLTRQTLRERVEAHVRAAHEAAREGAPVDLALAGKLGEVCLALLDDFDALREDSQRLIQAACLYFADSDDDEDDFRSMVGLEDDVRVVNYVVAQLGRDELYID